MPQTFIGKAFGLALAVVLVACAAPPSAPTPSAAEMDQAEQAVYSVIVSENFGPVVLLEQTATDVSAANQQQLIDYFKSAFPALSDETMDSYVARNRQIGPLAPDMELGIGYVLLSESDLQQISSQPNWGEVFAQNYSGSHGYYGLSRVGFNNRLDQAVVYVANVQGPKMGSGWYYQLTKANGAWTITQKVMVWIA